ncbi:hypothetical protein CpipJ_CPIJ000696 [Culex quinquefasciatus]|uniref:Uncharacterized protein n=1 Tax=Culex quinquefasciatus TaxID=7176 RepID=B0W0M7_CULQU|nr:hypothetical protein CpipJ_CPIJ000696 [Culex quinquefasciatus]|eukprot:XP_001842261.1 hypothetical protein CpipJ_CPIJ000696 [Culex quinquefasciatus]
MGLFSGESTKKDEIHCSSPTVSALSKVLRIVRVACLIEIAVRPGGDFKNVAMSSLTLNSVSDRISYTPLWGQYGSVKKSAGRYSKRCLRTRSWSGQKTTPSVRLLEQLEVCCEELNVAHERYLTTDGERTRTQCGLSRRGGKEPPLVTYSRRRI